MIRKVVLSNTAQRKLDKLIIYLIEEWSLKIKNEFISKLDNVVEQIKNNPELFPKSNKGNNVRKCVVTKHTTLFYKFDSNQIYILTIFDNRQNPDILKL